MQNFTLTLKSENIKVGKIPVSMSHSGTCPDACPLKKKGCYAGAGPLNWVWKRVDKGDFGVKWRSFIKKIKDLPEGIFWRHNQAGDLAGDNNIIDPTRLNDLIEANKGKRGFTYTHKPVLDNKRNAKLVQFSNQNGFTVNLSANNLSQADDLKALNIGPVVSILPSDFVDTKGVTPKGNRFVVCPAQTKEGVTCSSCQLCSKQRNIIVGFLAHGMAKKSVDLITKG